MNDDQRQKLKDERLGNGLGDVNGLSWPYFSVGFIGEKEAVIEESDKKILRELAKSVAEIAARPEQDQKRKLWEKHNHLLETQPLVFRIYG